LHKFSIGMQIHAAIAFGNPPNGRRLRPHHRQDIIELAPERRQSVDASLNFVFEFLKGSNG
jgi:hypothetical protein